MTSSGNVDLERRPYAVAPGETPASLLQLRLHVSLNEEHVYLSIILNGGQQLDLGERNHHYCLLTLARQRLGDAQRGIDLSGQGWLNRKQLARMLGLDPNHLNIQIHRLCRQITLVLPAGMQLDALIERRRGELRFGTLPFCIVRGSSVEGEFLPPRKPL